MHQHLKKTQTAYRFESEKNGKEKGDLIMESSDVFRAINPLRKKKKGQNAREKADTTCLKPTCMHALDVVWSGCICCRFVHARLLYKISNGKEILCAPRREKIFYA